MRAWVVSQLVADSSRSASASQSPPSRASSSAMSQQRTKPSASCGDLDALQLPVGRTTSRTGVETTGLPPARYSGVLVGEMNCVDSFIANGISATSQPDR